MLLLLLNGLPLLLLLLLLWSRLPLLLLLDSLMLLLLMNSLLRLLLLNGLTLLLLLRRLPLLLLLRNRLALLRAYLIPCLQRRWSPHVVIRRKRLADRDAGWTAMIDAGKLSPIGAGHALILHLRRHGRGTRRTQRRQLRGSRPHLHSARAAIEAHTSSAPVAAAHRSAIDVALH